MHSTKTDYLSKMISDAQGDQGKLFRRVKSMPNKKNSLPLPDNISKTVFCNQLNDFFITKIEVIRAEFNKLDNTKCHNFDESVVLQPLSEFKPVTIEQVDKQISTKDM